MSNVIQVRNVRIGDGIPKICVPIFGRTTEEIYHNVEKINTLPVDVIEWRSDFFQEAGYFNQIKSVLIELRKILPDTPIIFTFRTLNEGGERNLPINEYKHLNKAVADTGLVDFIDVELFSGDFVVREVIDYAHQRGVRVIVSNHDFHKTPEKEVIVNRLCKMVQLGADIPKIAVMPNSEEDVVELLGATVEMRKRKPECPIITVSMSELGIISRLAGETFGSALTFGALGKSSAPGQLQAEDLHNLLKLLHCAKDVTNIYE